MLNLKDQGLNEKQLEAAQIKEGPVLVVAGAGTGKTKTLTCRIANLVSCGVKPSEILAITFTNKAAGEMKERVEGMLAKQNLIAPEEALPTIKTFHGLGVLILRENHKLAGIRKTFLIYDSADSTATMKTALKNLDYELNNIDFKKVRSIIFNSKNSLKSPEELLKSPNPLVKTAGRVFHEYEELKRKDGALDFADLLSKMFHILKKHDNVLEFYRNRWKYIHVDEYQDTNTLQYEIVKLLAGDKKNIFAVGDIDQAIYTWRGATTRNMMDFEKDFPGTKTVFLENNYRSTENILELARTIIKKNKMRLDKNIVATTHEGDKVKLFIAGDQQDEARWVARKIKELLDSGESESDIAVLYRMNFQSRVLEESFLGHKIDYHVLGVKFFDRKEVKDIIAYIGLAMDGMVGVHLKRVLNTPKRGLGKVALIKILSGKENTLSAKQEKSYENFLGILKKIKDKINSECPPSEIVNFAVKISGYDEHLKNEGDIGAEKILNLKELVSFAGRYDSLPGAEGIMKMMEDISLLSESDNDTQSPKVRLMTIHASKGLEFNNVFITGLEQELFPGDVSRKEDPEEERRLMYVAVTRAKKRLFLSYAMRRNVYGKYENHSPSEFIEDVPMDMFEIESYSTNTFDVGVLQSGQTPPPGKRPKSLLDDDLPTIYI